MRISEDTAQQLLPWARLLNADFVWIHASATVLEATLAHSLNMIETPTLAVEMGVGMRITRQYTEQLVTRDFPGHAGNGHLGRTDRTGADAGDLHRWRGGAGECQLLRHFHALRGVWHSGEEGHPFWGRLSGR